MANNYDLGVVFTLSGVGGVTATYQNSASFPAGSATFARFKVVIVTDASSTMTAVTFKLQGVWTAAGTDTGDLISNKLDTNTSQPELEHAYSSLSTGTTYTFFVQADPRGFKGGLQCAVKATFSSGTSKAGDSVTISAVAW